jgi:hypothetical protein
VAFISGTHHSYPTPRALTNKNKLSLESVLHFSKYPDLCGEKNSLGNMLPDTLEIFLILQVLETKDACKT